MSNQTNITSATQFQEKSRVEALHWKTLNRILELEVLVVQYRHACVPFSERHTLLDRILVAVRAMFAQLFALSPPREEADEAGCEHIGSIVERELSKMAAELKARGAL